MYIIISTVLDILGIMTTIYKEYILLLSPLSQGWQKCFGGCTSICHGWQISKGNKAKNGRKVPNETNTSMSPWLLKRVSAAPGLGLYIPVHLAALSE